MNTQRWLTLGLLALAVACAATSSVWTAPFRDEDEASTPTAEVAESEEGSQAEEESAGLDSELTPVATSTLNPVLQDVFESAGGDNMGISNAPFIVLAGEFSSIDAMHQGRGTATIYQVGDERYVLRLDPFSVTNGPDLHVLLSPHSAPRTSMDALTGALDLGVLVGTDVAQNHQIPAGTSLNSYKSVVIYSLSLNLVYTSAELSGVRGR